MRGHVVLLHVKKIFISSLFFFFLKLFFSTVKKILHFKREVYLQWKCVQPVALRKFLFLYVSTENDYINYFAFILEPIGIPVGSETKQKSYIVWLDKKHTHFFPRCNIDIHHRVWCVDKKNDYFNSSCSFLVSRNGQNSNDYSCDIFFKFSNKIFGIHCNIYT